MADYEHLPDVNDWKLADRSHLYVARLPAELRWDGDGFEAAWETRPSEPHLVKMRGKLIPLPRGQQAFGATYLYTGTQNSALPVPPVVAPILRWSQWTHR